MKALSTVTAAEFNSVVKSIVKPGDRAKYGNITKLQRNLKMCGVKPSTEELRVMYAEIQAKFPHNKITFSMQAPVPYNGSFFNGLRVHLHFNKKPVDFMCPYEKLAASIARAEKRNKRTIPVPVKLPVLTEKEKAKEELDFQLLLVEPTSAELDIIVSIRQAKEQYNNMYDAWIKAVNCELYSKKVLARMLAECNKYYNKWQKVGINLTQ